MITDRLLFVIGFGIIISTYPTYFTSFSLSVFGSAVSDLDMPEWYDDFRYGVFDFLLYGTFVFVGLFVVSGLYGIIFDKYKTETQKSIQRLTFIFMLTIFFAVGLSGLISMPIALEHVQNTELTEEQTKLDFFNAMNLVIPATIIHTITALVIIILLLRRTKSFHLSAKEVFVK